MWMVVLTPAVGSRQTVQFIPARAARFDCETAGRAAMNRIPRPYAQNLAIDCKAR
jgi:hypothetical protein